MNKSLIIGVAIILGLAGSGAGAWSQLSPQAQMKRAVAHEHIDPSSAQFRNIRRGRRDVGWCGEVNAKNRMGAYNGYSPFYAIRRTDSEGGWSVLIAHDRADSLIQDAVTNEFCR